VVAVQLRACLPAGLREGRLSCRIHDLRHTHATMLLRQGVHPKVVQERLGHANVSITLDIYSHCTANMQREAAAKIDEALREALAR
jgi:integrase